jgi:hypothetical protein
MCNFARQTVEGMKESGRFSIAQNSGCQLLGECRAKTRVVFPLTVLCALLHGTLSNFSSVL